MSTSLPTAVTILAAGKGKRMGNPDLAKVLVPLAEQPLINHVLDRAVELGAERIVVIIGHRAEDVQNVVREHVHDARTVLQAEQLGTGHAVLMTEHELSDRERDILILSGDVPLITTDTLLSLLHHHRNTAAVATILTTVVDNPTGYGRIVRSADGAIARIVEEKDATEDERTIREINSGVYVVRSSALFSALHRVRNDNAQGEFYLTDIVDILLKDGAVVATYVCDDPAEVHGINTPDDLRAAELLYTQRQESL